MLSAIESPSGRGVALGIRDLSIGYPNGVTAARTVTLDLQSGEFLSLVGPSGCGKSSLLRVVGGLLEPKGGRMSMVPPPARGEVGVVFQDATLLPWRTAMGNVELPLELQGVPKEVRAKAALDMLAHVGLGDAAGRLPRQLSGGMKMRVALARAAVCQPRLMLLDEPFGALDEMTRQRLQHLVMRMWLEEGFTAVFVTHSISEAVFLGQRIGVMCRTPGELPAVIDVPLPFPRTEEMRTEKPFNDVARAVVEALHT